MLEHFVNSKVICKRQLLRKRASVLLLVCQTTGVKLALNNRLPLAWWFFIFFGVLDSFEQLWILVTGRPSR